MNYNRWQSTLNLKKLLKEWHNNKQKIFLMKEKLFMLLKNVRTSLK